MIQPLANILTQILNDPAISKTKDDTRVLKKQNWQRRANKAPEADANTDKFVPREHPSGKMCLTRHRTNIHGTRHKLGTTIVNVGSTLAYPNQITE